MAANRAYNAALKRKPSGFRQSSGLIIFFFRISLTSIDEHLQTSARKTSLTAERFPARQLFGNPEQFKTKADAEASRNVELGQPDALVSAGRRGDSALAASGEGSPKFQSPGRFFFGAVRRQAKPKEAKKGIAANEANRFGLFGASCISVKIVVSFLTGFAVLMDLP
jgi:hypothetical protein